MISNLEITGNVAKFTFEGLVKEANRFRVILMEKTPCVAFNLATIYSNTSFIFDEVLFDRVGLIPIQADVSKLEEGETLTFRLGVYCDKHEMTVKASDIVFVPKDDQLERLGNVGAVDPDTVIVTLVRGQDLVIEFQAGKGYGEQHLKYRPIVNPSFYLEEGRESEVTRNKFRFRVESTGSMPIEQIIDMAVKLFNE